MKDQDLLERITLNPKVVAGKPIIKGTRLTVEYILGLLAHGATTEEILEEYQGLKPEDIQAKISSVVAPWASRLRTYSTVRRVPWMIGLPAIILGFRVIRSSNS